MRKIAETLGVYSELRILFNQMRLVPSGFLSSNYPGLSYNCSCGSQHALSTTEFFLCTKSPSGFVFCCENDICTLATVKGFFKIKVTEEWCADKDIFLDAYSRFINGDKNLEVFSHPILNDVNSISNQEEKQNITEEVRIDKFLYLFDYKEHYESILNDIEDKDRMICELYLFRAWTTQLGFRLFSNDENTSEKIIGETVNISKFGAGILAQTAKVDIEHVLNQKYIDVMSERWEAYDDTFIENKDDSFGSRALAKKLIDFCGVQSVNGMVMLPMLYLSHLEQIKEEAQRIGLIDSTD